MSVRQIVSHQGRRHGAISITGSPHRQGSCGYSSSSAQGLAALGLSQAADVLSSGQHSAQELLQASQAQAGRFGWINAVIGDMGSSAREAAAAADAVREQGARLGALEGVPVLVKDNFCVAGTTTTAGSKFLSNFIAPYTATVVSKLTGEGAVVVGKTNMDEFGMGSANTNSAFGPCLNPWASQEIPRVAGGSSGGSAAAVAAGLAVAALGSDTGGSVRLPASYCGVVGMKPSYGRLSRHGLVAFASSLDCPGVITRSVPDAALMLAIMQGQDGRDSTVLPPCPDLADLLTSQCFGDWSVAAQGAGAGPSLLKGLRVGVPDEYNQPGVKDEVRQVLAQTIDKLKRAGAVVNTVSLPHTEAALGAYYTISPAEASSNLSRYDGLRFGVNAYEGMRQEELNAENLTAHKAAVTVNRSAGFGTEVQRRILAGTFALSSDKVERYFLKAQKIRRLASQDFYNAFQEVDVLITPVAPHIAPTLADIQALGAAEMYASDIMTVPASLAGLPALSIPAGLSDDMPVGIQLICPRLADAKLFRIAAELEAELKGWDKGRQHKLLSP